MPEHNFAESIPHWAFAFRGYDIENLGRSHELLEHATYGPILRQQLVESSAICSELVGRSVDLVARVESQVEPTLDEYDESIALVLAVERAQMACLYKHHGVEFEKVRLVTGFSLGEIAALTECGTVSHKDAMSIPLTLAEDCVALAHDVELGILFSRQGSLKDEEVAILCQRITQQGNGVVGVSAILSPNSMLIMGQKETVRQFKKLAKTELTTPASVRINKSHWPPLHTPIVWCKAIPNRAAVLLQTLNIKLEAPTPPVLSMVTGNVSYQAHNARDIVHQWIDHPQRLWDVVYEILSRGIETVVHVGPAPNIIPATFKRLSENIELQTKGSFRTRTLSRMARRPWLGALLPQRAALLRAPFVQHIILEDWLLDSESESA